MFDFDTIMSKFSEQCYSVCDYNTFNPEEYFSSYHHYEVYNPEKEYTKGKFEGDFGKGVHTYEYCVYTLGNKSDIKTSIDTANGENPEEKKRFIVAKEVVSQEELEGLMKYCNCAYHKAGFLSKISSCPCCVGCLESGPEFAQQHNIDEARRRKEEDESKVDDGESTLNKMNLAIAGFVTFCLGLYVVSF